MVESLPRGSGAAWVARASAAPPRWTGGRAPGLAAPEPSVGVGHSYRGLLRPYTPAVATLARLLALPKARHHHDDKPLWERSADEECPARIRPGSQKNRRAGAAAGLSRCRVGRSTLLGFISLAGFMDSPLPTAGNTVVLTGQPRGQSTAIPTRRTQRIQRKTNSPLPLLPTRTAPIGSPPVAGPAPRCTQPTSPDILLPSRPERFNGLLVKVVDATNRADDLWMPPLFRLLMPLGVPAGRCRWRRTRQLHDPRAAYYPPPLMHPTQPDILRTRHSPSNSPHVDRAQQLPASIPRTIEESQVGRDKAGGEFPDGFADPPDPPFSASP